MNDTALLQSFSKSIARAHFIKSTRESLLTSSVGSDSLQSGSGTPTLVVAVVVATLSFFVASIFCYGMMRREMRRHPEPSVRYKNKSAKSSPWMGVVTPIQLDSRRRFVRLDELTPSPLDQQNQTLSAPGITWSISDMTSDSLSMQSGVSYRLERIEEDTEDRGPNVDGREDVYMLSRAAPSKVDVAEELRKLDHFSEGNSLDAAVDMDGLQGCQYIVEDFNEGDDGRVGELTETQLVDLRSVLSTDSSDNQIPREEYDDLQISMEDEEESEILQQIISSVLDVSLSEALLTDKTESCFMHEDASQLELSSDSHLDSQLLDSLLTSTLISSEEHEAIDI